MAAESATRIQAVLPAQVESSDILHNTTDLMFMKRKENEYGFN